MSVLSPLRGGIAHSVLVALTLFGLMSHICVLPSAAEIVAAGPGETHHQGDDDGSDGSHLASCDSTVSRAAVSASGAPAHVQFAPASPRVEQPPAAPRVRVVHSNRMPGSDVGPPLFLLHASLLI